MRYWKSGSSFHSMRHACSIPAAGTAVMLGCNSRTPVYTKFKLSNYYHLNYFERLSRFQLFSKPNGKFSNFMANMAKAT